jgi:hypothetical protein
MWERSSQIAHVVCWSSSAVSFVLRQNGQHASLWRLIDFAVVASIAESFESSKDRFLFKVALCFVDTSKLDSASSAHF